jgi:hypothetical protein
VVVEEVAAAVRHLHPVEQKVAADSQMQSVWSMQRVD